MTDEIKKKLLANGNIKMIYLGIPLQDGKDTKSLASVLETKIPKKYFLSEKLMKSLMRQNGTFQAMRPRDLGGVAATLTARMAKMGRGDNYIHDMTNTTKDLPTPKQQEH